MDHDKITNNSKHSGMTYMAEKVQQPQQYYTIVTTHNKCHLESWCVFHVWWKRGADSLGVIAWVAPVMLTDPELGPNIFKVSLFRH